MDKKNKAVLLAPLPPPYGGIQTWTVRVTQTELKNGWSFAVVDEKPVGRGIFGTKNKRNYLREIGRCRNIWHNLKKEIKSPDVKIVHSCIPSYTLSMMREYVCACIAKRKGKKFVTHFRCTVPNTTQGQFGWKLLKKLCDKSDMIFALNTPSEESLKKISKTPVKIIPNFVSRDEIAEAKTIGSEMKTVLFIGGMIEPKGVKDLLDIAKKMPELYFRFVGDGDDFSEYVRENGIGNAVFTGQKDRAGVKEELKNADVFAFLSHFRGEGFSNALCEAMAAGLPCLVTDWAANADMIGNDGGEVIDVGDIDSAVDALNKMKPYEVRKKQSDANMEKVKKLYNDRVVSDMIVDAYEEILGEKA